MKTPITIILVIIIIKYNDIIIIIIIIIITTTLEPLLFNEFNDLCAQINYSKSLLSADDLKIYRHKVC
jgi:hypothetical protein